jgi:hypothetical protein
VTTLELANQQYLRIDPGPTHDRLVRCKLHGVIADCGSRFWYPQHVLWIERRPPFSDRVLTAIGIDPDLNDALYAVWLTAIAQNFHADALAHQLIQYLSEALPDLYWDPTG